MTTASKITLIRVVLIPVYMVLMLLGYTIPALIVFIVASLTDFVDGQIARRCNQVSDFGKFLDPLADKLLVIAAMVIFVQWGRMPSWALMVVLTREFAVTGLRLISVGNGRVIAAGWSGKIKTASTMVGLCVMMAAPSIAPLAAAQELLDCIIVWIIVLTTLISGIEYFCKNWDVFGLKK